MIAGDGSKLLTVTVDGFELIEGHFRKGTMSFYSKDYPNGNTTYVTDETGRNLPIEGSCLIETYGGDEPIAEDTCDNEEQMNDLVTKHEELYGK